MARGLQGKAPHEILGVKPGADFIEISEAFNRLSRRWAPENNPGDEVAAARFRRLEKAYEALSDRAYEAVPIDPPVAAAPGLSRAERAENFMLRMRIRAVAADWKRYMSFVDQRHQIVDEIKRQQGDRFLRLKAVFRGTEEDRNRWEAERYLRAPHEAAGCVYNLRDLYMLIISLAAIGPDDPVGLFDHSYVADAEREVKARLSHVEQAQQVLRRERPYIDFYKS